MLFFFVDFLKTLDKISTIYYYISMKIVWNEDKNKLLKTTRGLSFEQVKEEIESERILYQGDNPKRENQKIVVVDINDYPCVVPFVIDEKGDWFLKTIYPSRKIKKELESD